MHCCTGHATINAKESIGAAIEFIMDTYGNEQLQVSVGACVLEESERWCVQLSVYA